MSRFALYSLLGLLVTGIGCDFPTGPGAGNGARNGARLGTGVDTEVGSSGDQAALDVGASEFQQHLKGSGLVLVKFGAPWCAPCRRMDAELEKVARANQGLVTVLRVDVDDEPNLAKRYQISSIPRSFLFHQGQKIGDWTGFRDASDLQQSIDQVENTAVSSPVGEVKPNPFAAS